MSQPNETFWQRFQSKWEWFWFTPADPSLLALIRICCGAITLYTIITYTYTLQQFMGPDAWLSLEQRLYDVRNRPNPYVTPLRWDFLANHRPPETEQERDYALKYFNAYGQEPPGEYPKTDEELIWIEEFIRKFNHDPRRFGLTIPKSQDERDYVMRYAGEFRLPPPPPYPYKADGKTWDREREEAIRDYFRQYGQDPRLNYVTGTPVWSIWFHVTDPTWMMIVQWMIVVVTFLFVIGFATRITSVLTWFGALSYTHRCPVIVFGVDTMMNILLIYLMLAPCGAALSVDRLLARWWSRSRPRIVGRWKAFWGQAAGDIYAPPPPPAHPEPSVAANVAIRLLQIHVCIIYFIAGVAKLQGKAWWEGTAVWGTLANFEFAPMQYELYNFALRVIGRNRIAFEIFMTVGTYFTLAFEISYCYLIWLRPTRWVLLGMAIILHGFIGMFMGLKTFSLMMLVMNMGFLRPNEVQWFVKWFTWLVSWPWTKLPPSTPPASDVTSLPAPERNGETATTATRAQ